MVFMAYSGLAMLQMLGIYKSLNHVVLNTLNIQRMSLLTNQLFIKKPPSNHNNDHISSKQQEPSSSSSSSSSSFFDHFPTPKQISSMESFAYPSFLPSRANDPATFYPNINIVISPPLLTFASKASILNDLLQLFAFTQDGQSRYRHLINLNFPEHIHTTHDLLSSTSNQIQVQVMFLEGTSSQDMICAMLQAHYLRLRLASLSNPTIKSLQFADSTDLSQISDLSEFRLVLLQESLRFIEQHEDEFRTRLVEQGWTTENVFFETDQVRLHI